MSNDFSWTQRMREHANFIAKVKKLRPALNDFRRGLKSGSIEWPEALEIYNGFLKEFTTRDGINMVAKRLLGWAFLNAEAIELIANWIIQNKKPVFSVGCGNAIWEGMVICNLRYRGVNNPEKLMIVSDTFSSHGSEDMTTEDCFCTTVIKEDGMKSILKANALHDSAYALMMNWPGCNEGWANEVLQASYATTVFYCGECKFGCTGDDDLYDTLEVDYHEVQMVYIPRAIGINDYLFMYHARNYSAETVFYRDLMVNFDTIFNIDFF